MKERSGGAGKGEIEDGEEKEEKAKEDKKEAKNEKQGGNPSRTALHILPLPPAAAPAEALGARGDRPSCGHPGSARLVLRALLMMDGTRPAVTTRAHPSASRGGRACSPRRAA